MSVRKVVAAVALFLATFAIGYPALASHFSPTYLFSNSAFPNHTFVQWHWMYETSASTRPVRYWSYHATLGPTSIATYESILPTDDWVDTEATSAFTTSVDRWVNIHSGSTSGIWQDACGTGSTAVACYSLEPGGDYIFPGGRGGYYQRYATIWLNTYTVLNTNGYNFTTNGWKSTVNHELGHISGLNDYGNCSTATVMGPVTIESGRVVDLLCGTLTVPINPTTADRNDIVNFYSSHTPDAGPSATASGRTITWRWIDWDYADRHYVADVYQVGYGYRSTFYAQTNISRRGVYDTASWTAPAAGAYHICIASYNATDGFSAYSCGPNITVS